MMKIDQAQLEKVETKLNKQNALMAALGACIWAMPTLVLWFLVYSQKSTFGPIMMLVSGLIIGLAVRFHGKGLNRLFSVIAFIVYTWLVVLAFALDIAVGGATWAVFLFGLYAAGAGIAIRLARIEVPFEEHKAHTYLTSMQRHTSDKKLLNRWFIVLPVLVIGTGLSSLFTASNLVFFEQYLSDVAQVQAQVAQKDLNQRKEIDVTPQGLEHRSTEEILRYAYAYSGGLLFNRNGRHTTPYPSSSFKAQTLLRYLVEYRDNARAKFILGFITGGVEGAKLLEQAAEQGDKYAKVYSAVIYGCYTDSDLAVNLLTQMQQTMREKHIQDEIYSILYVGFKGICRDLEEPEFVPSYVLNYSDKN